MNPFRLLRALPHQPVRRLALAAAGLLILGILARRVDWHQVAGHMATIRWPFLLGGVVAGLAGMLLRGWRLSVLLGSAQRFLQVFKAIVLGYFGALFLPLGGGEACRILGLRTLAGFDGSTALGAALVDRTFDVLGLGLVLAGVLLGHSQLALTRWREVLGLLAAAGGLGALGLLGVLVLRGAHPMLDRLAKRLRSFLGTLAGIALSPRWFRALAIQILITAADLAGLYVAVHAFPFGGRIPFVAVLKLNLYTMLGALLPLLPGGLGPAQAACLLALVPEGVSPSEALAYSVVGQAATILTILLLALLVVARHRPEEAD